MLAPCPHASTRPQPWAGSWDGHGESQDAGVYEKPNTQYGNPRTGTIYAEAAKGKRGASNAGYHYLGCAKTFALMGKAFADANLAMMKGRHDR